MRYDPSDRRPPSRKPDYDRNMYDPNMIDRVQEEVRKTRASGAIYLESSPNMPYDINTIYDADNHGHVDHKGVNADGVYYIEYILNDCLPVTIRQEYYSAYVLYVFKRDTSQYQILVAGSYRFIRRLIEDSRRYVWSEWATPEPDTTVDTLVALPPDKRFAKEAEICILADNNGRDAVYPLTVPEAIIDPTTKKTLTEELARTMISVNSLEERDAIPYDQKADGKIVRVMDSKTGNPTYWYWDKTDGIWVRDPYLNGQGNVLNVWSDDSLSESLLWNRM